MIYYIQNKEVIQSRIGDEIVMLDVESGFYFGLNSVASVIWEMMKEKVDLETMVDALMKEFDVDKSTCESDTLELLGQMAEKKIISIVQ
jgi:ABC-type transport system involved in Fe-S cluster assembly fused permease/ATPase subunit